MGRFINADALVATGQGILGNNMFAYCRNNPVCRRDVSGATDEKCYDDGTNLLHEEKSYEGGKISTGDSSGSGGNSGPQAPSGGGGEITLYRAASPAESSSATTTQSFSSGNNSYEGSKFFATSQADAQKWGNAMYMDGNYKVISGTFNSSVTASPGVIYYPRLDGIGPAYLIPLAALNNSIINICCI